MNSDKKPAIRRLKSAVDRWSSITRSTIRIVTGLGQGSACVLRFSHSDSLRSSNIIKSDQRAIRVISFVIGLVETQLADIAGVAAQYVTVTVRADLNAEYIPIPL